MNSFTLMIRKISHSFHRSTGIPVEDLIQEASLAYLEATKNHDHDKGSLSTIVYLQITHRLINFSKEVNRHKHHSCELVSLDKIPTNRLICYQSRFFENLSPEAQAMAQVILRSPRAFQALDYHCACRRLYLIMKQQGWSINKIRVGLHDLRKACS